MWLLFFFFDQLILAFISSAAIPAPYNIMSAATGLGSVADPDKTARHNHASSYCLHLLIVCAAGPLFVPVPSVTVTLFQHIQVC